MVAVLAWLINSRRPHIADVPLVGPHAPDRARAQPLAAVLVLVIEPVAALKRDPAAGCSMMTAKALGHASRPLAITIMSTASLSTSTILRGRLMRVLPLARQPIR